MSVFSKISEAELEVLRVLWAKDRSIAESEICEDLKHSKNWDRSTVRTLVRRLTEKEALYKEKREVYYYSPAITEKDYTAKQTNMFIDKMYKGSVRDMIASLFEQEQVSPDDMEALKKYWNGGEKSVE